MKIKPSNKLLFLDFDGVIRTGRSITNRDKFKNGADSDSVTELNRIIKLTKAKIVFSTSWRPTGRGLAKINRLIASWGVTSKGVSSTPRLDGSDPRAYFTRGQEIAAWFQVNNLIPGECRFVILDDDEDIEPLKDNLVLCPFETGLSYDLADEAIRRLNR